MRGAGLARLAGCALVALLLSGAVRARSEPVKIRFPAGDCERGWIEVQVYDRSYEIWRSHGTHPRVAPGQCIVVDSGILLNEIRVRCIDPYGRRAPSPWVVGANVWRPVAAGECATP